MHSFDNTDSAPISKTRWIIAMAFGFAFWLVAIFASQFVPQVVLGMELQGKTFALVGAIQAFLGTIVIMLALKFAGSNITKAGLVFDRVGNDAALGIAIALIFALLQFLVIIPLTGGASRSDVIANVAQLGKEPLGLLSFITLAWLGGWSEELAFRGLLAFGLISLLGHSIKSKIVVTVIVAIIFGLLHGYQGWAGVIDTGLYGGILLTAVYLWTGRLLPSIIAHALWNTVAAIVLFAFY